MKQLLIGGWVAAALTIVLPCSIAQDNLLENPFPPYVQQDQPAAQEKSAQPAPSSDLFGIPVHGVLSSRYRWRSNGDDRDQDLYEYLSTDIGDPDRNKITGHLFLRATEDIDGSRDKTGYYAFDNITDSYDSRFNARFYLGYVDVHRVPPLETLRVGRQMLDDTSVPFYIDGVHAATREFMEWNRLQIGLYGGVPVHLFESSMRGDTIYGTYLQGNLWNVARARFDYARVRDSYTLGTARNDLFGVRAWKTLWNALHLHYQQNFLDKESRDLLVRGIYTNPDIDLRIQFSHFQLQETQNVLAIDLDSFYQAAQSYYPYSQDRLVIAKGFGEHLLVEVGADVRERRDDEREAPLNREFRRFYIAPAVINWPYKGSTATVTFEAWEVPGSDNGDIRTAGFDFSHRCTEALKIAAGTSYALYKYDYFQDEERDHVRTYYARMNYAIMADTKLDLRYEHEHGDLDDFDTVTIGFARSF